MKVTTKRINKQLKKDPTKLIGLSIGLAVIIILFVIACLYKLYISAYTTQLQCDANKCSILKIDILGNKTKQYTFDSDKLNLIKLNKKKNIIGKEVYSITLTSGKLNKIYLLTGETKTEAEQYVYLNQIRAFLENYKSGKTLELENPRYQLKFWGLGVAGAGSLIALLLIIECIKGIIKFKKEQNRKKYHDILK